MEITEKNTLRKIVIVIVLLSIAAAVYILYPRAEEQAFNGSGKIDIGGYSLYTKSEGEGRPAVIFDSGYGMTYTQWYSVLKEIENQTRTVVYSRAGIGGSDKSPLDRTCETKAEELHKLLSASKIKGPYILVGHSLGGFDLRLFAAKYPKEVAGIILVDASHEDQLGPSLEEMPEKDRKDFSADGSYEDLVESVEQVRKVRNTLKDIPMTVIVAQKNHDDTWLEFQKEMASLSAKSKLIMAENSAHNIPGDEPEVVADAIIDMLNKVKK